ncbi:MAG: hypothetical protein N2Z80_05975 [Hydrogenothermaceae bacterium]|nr:hypothetical protein [Hydrogenothermaceae bacterium]
MKSSLVVVAPMQTGGGIQNKILQSMALGTINMVSKLASIPIGGENWKHYIVEDDPKNIADIINSIKRDPKKYMYLKHNSREFVKNNFTWSIYENNLIKAIEEVMNGNKAKGLKV